MDINLGQFTLTKNQVSNLITLRGGKLNGFSYWQDGTIVAVANADLDGSEIETLKASINGLSDTLSQQAASDLFNIQTCKGRLYQVFADRMTLMAQYSGLVMGLLDFKEFAGLKTLANAVLSGQDLTDFKSVFAEQSISLDGF